MVFGDGNVLPGLWAGSGVEFEVDPLMEGVGNHGAFSTCCHEVGSLNKMGLARLKKVLFDRGLVRISTRFILVSMCAKHSTWAAMHLRMQ